MLYPRSSTSFVYALNTSIDCIFHDFVCPFMMASKKKKLSFESLSFFISHTTLSCISMIEYHCPCKIVRASSIFEAERVRVSFWFHLEQIARNCIFYISVAVSGSMVVYSGILDDCTCVYIFWKKFSNQESLSTSIQRLYISFSEAEIVSFCMISRRNISLSFLEENERLVYIFL